MPRPAPSKIKRHLRYDPKTGAFWWKLAKAGRRLNRQAGRLSKKSYRIIGFDYAHYGAHQLAWVIVKGRWPKKEMDHKNRKRWDNRWSNLREATTGQNRANNGLRKDNATGCTGVSWHAPRQKWRARIMRNQREKHLGLFTSKKKARLVYIAATKVYFGEFARAR